MRHPSVIARRVAAASVSLVVAAGAAACGPKDNDAKSSGGDAKPQKGGTLTVLNANPQEDFDPARLYTSGGGNVPSSSSARSPHATVRAVPPAPRSFPTSPRTPAARARTGPCGRTP